MLLKAILSIGKRILIKAPLDALVPNMVNNLKSNDGGKGQSDKIRQIAAWGAQIVLVILALVTLVEAFKGKTPV